MERPARISLISFLLGCVLLVFAVLCSFDERANHIFVTYWKLVLAIDIAITNVLLFVFLKGETYQVACHW